MPERLRRVAASAALVGVCLALASPLALAFGPEERRACARGHCCCAKPATSGPCVRAACHCGDGSPAAVVTSTLDEGVLPAPVAVAGADDERTLTGSARSLPLAPDLSPPDHPPPFSLSTR